MDKRVVEQVLRKSLGLKDGESVLVVTDTLMERVARSFHDAAIALGVDAALVSMPPRKVHGEEPPPSVAAAMRSSPVAILLTSTSLTHTKARREACEKHAVRIASMPGVDPDRLERLLSIDYEKHEAWCEELAKQLEGSHRFRFTSNAGTDLSFRTAGRRIHRDVGRITKPGQFGNLPCGEVCFAPQEGTAEGVVVVDGSITGLGLVGDPVKIVIKAGRAVEISDPKLQALLEKHGEPAFTLAEFGIGTNSHAEIVGSAVEDEKASGTAHIALGSNAWLGGEVHVPVHIDLVVLKPALAVDGKEIPEKFLAGQPKTRRSQPPAPPPLDLVAEGAFRELFDHSNDAQYVLDLETQRFIEVNPAFEKMTGYSREEAVSGAITAPGLVARESQATFQQKSQNRKYSPSERYDLKLLCKGGEKKSVELSVRRMILKSRDVIIGSVRDLSARKKLEQEMWEKIEDLGFANNRILALTEKIRRVPELATKLFAIGDEAELLERTAETLCEREGLGYADVTFYLARAEGLELSFSTVPSRKRKSKVEPGARPARVLSGEDRGEMTKTGAFLPLKGRDGNIGVIEVAFHPKEIEVLEGNDRALKGYQDLLVTLSNIIGLRLDNLHLYETVRMQSIVDQTTGVYNRRWFDTKLLDEIHRSSRYGRSLSLLLIDLDYFKQVNDTYGHKEGDIVLQESAKIFRHYTREVDIVCRIGGDEFAIIMPETAYDSALAKAEQLRREIKAKDFENIVDPAKPAKISLSIGVTAYTPDVTTPDEMVKQADTALYAAKKAGRNTYIGALTRPKGAPPGQ